MRLPLKPTGLSVALLAAAKLLVSVASGEPLPRFQPTREQLRRADARSDDADRPPAKVYKLRIAARWSADGGYFWYRNELPSDRREYVLVDAEAGTRSPAFDHDRLAAALASQGIDGAQAERLPISSLWIDRAAAAMEFRAGGEYWRCDLGDYALSPLAASARNDEAEGVAAWAPEDAPRASLRTGEETELTFVNRTSGEVRLFWIDGAGERQPYATLGAGQEHSQHTFAGHVWAVEDGAGRTLAVYVAEATPGVCEVTTAAPRRRRRDRPWRPDPRRPSRQSPDGKWTAIVRDGNVFLRSAEESSADDEAEAVPLSTDGRDGFAYDRVEWSPDSRTIVAFRVEPGDSFQTHLIESSPPGGGRARLHSRPYPLPGDRYDAYELNLFDVASRRQRKPEVERIDFGRPRLRWLDGGERFAYEKVDRGHQRFRLMEVDCRTGQARSLIDERTKTFIWTEHVDAGAPPLVTWLERTPEIIYASERDGWRRLYLVDAANGTVKNQITRGAWVVRGIERIDEEARQIWFRASGGNAEQDPYFIHEYRVNFDGSGLVALTTGDGNHRVEFSPDRRFLIDSYSRVDRPPVHELRRAADGTLVFELERADVSELEAGGWQPPEPFVAKGRDGATDIWGVICRPANFDPGRRYPVVECLYAGPQGSYTPKSFSDRRLFAELTDLGFVVVQIDGMGTAHRSKAFHDVCWHNLKDAGLPDRRLWHQAAAAKYPWYDVERLGVYGVSAGGQNAVAAVLFHGDFYKAAVAACGCHDNRMDKASWNEQWMGYPVGPQYAASSNIEHADRLTGALLLIVGEMDDNVPPESTYRLADALVKAGKDFELVVVPGAGHGMGGPFGERKLRDFFVRELFGAAPPRRNGGEDVK